MSKIEVDFEGREQLLEQLRKVAQEEERSLSKQIIFIIKKNLKDWIGIDAGRNQQKRSDRS